jgi:integrase
MVNRHNYRQAQAFLEYLTAIRQLRAGSVRRYWSYLKHLLIWADETPFSEVARIRPSFPDYLKTFTYRGDRGSLAQATLKKIVQAARRLFDWLKANYPREFRGLPSAWVAALQPPKARPPAPDHQFVPLQEVRQLCSMRFPKEDLAARRDQAAAAMLFLSGMRGGAFSSLSLACVDLPNRQIKQWPSLGVHTKNGISATTYLLEIPELLAVVKAWDQFVRERLPATAVWYTPTCHKWGAQQLYEGPPGAHRNIALAKRLCKLFSAAGLPYKSPHKFRHGHAVYGLQHAKTMADYKAVSMNLMHANLQVTDGIYAPLLNTEVKRRIAALNRPARRQPDDPLEQIIHQLSNPDLAKALLIIADRLAA